ncbi:hypothetical protein MIMGU_mgv11b022370mg, partial [Erythranthe guttata]
EPCSAIKNILLSDSECERDAVKYYSDEWPTNNAKLAFEKSVCFHGKCKRLMLEQKFVQDLHFFVTAIPLRVFFEYS